MNKNFEILNYLNLISTKLGKKYAILGKSCLPNDFVLTDELIKERLQMKNFEKFVELPKFVYGEKKEIKKNFKNSIKNMKKLQKNLNLFDFSNIFTTKFENYLVFRIDLTKIILKEFKNYDFNEIESLKEIFAIDPIFGELLIEIFDDNPNFEHLMKDLEEKYSLTRLKKQKILEKNSNIQLQDVALNQNLLNNEKSKNSQKIEKKVLKITKNSEKIVKISKNDDFSNSKNNSNQKNRREK